MPGRIISLFRNLLRRNAVEQALDDELKSSVELLTEEKMSEGLSRSEARRRALIELGGVEQVRTRVREIRVGRLFDDFAADLRFTLRQLRKNPGFTAVAVLSLALGIGASTAVFSLVNAILLRSLPVPNPQELRVLRWTGSDVRMTSLNDFPDMQGNLMSAHAVTHPAFLALRDQGAALADIFGFQPVDQQEQVTARVKEETFTAKGMMVSDNFFSCLGVSPLIGRPLNAREDFSGSSVNVVISYEWWERYFGLDPAVLGQTILLNGRGFTVVGVLPRGFTGVVPGDPSGFYVPMSAQSPFLYRPIAERFHWFVRVMARLKPAVSDAQLRAALDVAFAREAGPIMKDPRILLEPGYRGLASESNSYRKPLLLMQGVVGLVLLVACFNLAGLMAARGAVRQHELAVRVALGTGRWRLIRQSFTESLVLASIGGGLGILLSIWGKTALSRLFAESTDGLRYDLTLDLTVLCFGVIAALVSALVAGLLPALQAGHVDPIAGLRSRGAIGAPRLRIGKVLVVAQICISMLLLTCAGLYTRTLINLTHVDIGFNTEKLLLFEVNPGGSGYDDPARRTSFYAEVQDSLSAIPGVRGATFLSYPPLGHAGWSGAFFFRDSSSEQAEKMQSSRLAVGETFFDTMDIPIIQGRGFNAADARGTPKVVVVNEALVRQYSPDRNPIGRMVHILTDDWQIIGVCRDVKYRSLREAPQPTVYYPFRQISFGVTMRSNFKDAYFALRTAEPPMSVVTAARKAVSAVDPRVQVENVATQEAVRDADTGQERLFAVLCGALAGLAMLLCCIGLYGLMSYHVARRTPEFATRMALGADRRDIANPILREALLLAAAGFVLGLPAALGVTRLITSQLYGVAPNDPLALIGSGILLAAIAVLTAWLPARRAASIEPMQALRNE
ncbi:MAG: ABC transporter permease [Terracidiphilus sp.]